jgi:peptidoglycan-associated lipoprotein
MRKFFVIFMCVVINSLIGCSHKPVSQAEGPSNLSASVAPNVAENQPELGFDSQGSDSQKIEGLETVHFAYDKSALSKAEREILKKNAQWIQAHPKIKMQVEGHCDNRGSVEYNLALGERRAKAVVQYLSDLGIKKDRLTFMSFGKEKPIANGDSESDFAKNRRANFVPMK